MTDLINEIQEAARIEGFEQGTKFGFAEGNEAGLEVGQIEGFTEGTKFGYMQGYEDAEVKYQSVIASLESLVDKFKLQMKSPHWGYGMGLAPATDDSAKGRQFVALKQLG